MSAQAAAQTAAAHSSTKPTRVAGALSANVANIVDHDRAGIEDAPDLAGVIEFGQIALKRRDVPVSRQISRLVVMSRLRRTARQPAIDEDVVGETAGDDAAL